MTLDSWGTVVEWLDSCCQEGVCVSEGEGMGKLLKERDEPGITASSCIRACVRRGKKCLYIAYLQRRFVHGDGALSAVGGGLS